MTGTTRVRPQAGTSNGGRSAKEVAYEHLRREILGDPGTETRFIAEETVGALLGLSRTPVREAFLRLAAEGLLTLVPRKGAMVLPVTERQVREVMEVRSVVETWSVAKVLETAAHRERLVATLRANHEELTLLGCSADASSFIECDRVFHRELVAAADNQVMLDLYERMRDQQLRMGVRAVAGHPDRMEAVRREHAEIIDAIAAGEPLAAQAAVRRHLDATGASLFTRQLQ